MSLHPGKPAGLGFVSARGRENGTGGSSLTAFAFFPATRSPPQRNGPWLTARLGDEREAEAQVIAPVAGVDDDAERHPAVVGAAVPGAAAAHAVRA